MNDNNSHNSKNRFMPLIAATLVLTGACLYDFKKVSTLPLPSEAPPKKKMNLKKKLEAIVAASNKKGFLQTLRKAVERREKV